MSSTIAPDVLSTDNPITADAVRDTLAKIGLDLPDKSEIKDYTSLLTGIWEVWSKVNDMDDYVPTVDEDRFPRLDIHKPLAEDNPANAWAWRVTIKDRKKNNGLLKDKTVCLKDNIGVKDVPCLLGTNFIQDWIPNTDATVCTRILEAGGTVIGKSVCENMSLWGVSSSSAQGPLHNVHAPGFSAGGSSSGSAVLVARGDVDLGVGGDQGGSIRIPASKNGIVGLKPTTGLVPYTGIASLEPILDHVGPMTRTVLDNALFLQVLAGADGIDDRQQAGCPFPGQVEEYSTTARQGVKGLRIGILKESLDCPLHDKRVSDLVIDAANRLSELGAVVGHVSVPMHRDAPDLWAVVGRLSAASSLLGRSCGRRQLYLNDLTDKILPITQDRFEHMFVSGTNTLINGLWGWDNMPPTLLGKATNLTRKLRDAYYAALDEYDVLVTPTLPYLAKRLPSDNAKPIQLMVNSAGLTLNTAAFNLTGMPALSIPVGRLASEEDATSLMPVGMQLVGKFYSEGLLYRVAYAWEQAFGGQSQ